MVSISHLAAGFLLTSGIVRPSAMHYKQSWSSMTVYSARPTKYGLTLHGRPWSSFMVDHECMYDSKARRYAEDNRQNRIVRTGKAEAEVTNNKNCTLGIVLLKLSTGRHEASCGLFAMAELLVLLMYPMSCSALILFRLQELHSASKNLAPAIHRILPFEGPVWPGITLDMLAVKDEPKAASAAAAVLSYLVCLLTVCSGEVVGTASWLLRASWHCWHQVLRLWT